jgi:hypothetical protein
LIDNHYIDERLYANAVQFATLSADAKVFDPWTFFSQEKTIHSQMIGTRNLEADGKVKAFRGDGGSDFSAGAASLLRHGIGDG